MLAGLFVGLEDNHLLWGDVLGEARVHERVIHLLDPSFDVCGRSNTKTTSMMVAMSGV